MRALPQMVSSTRVVKAIAMALGLATAEELASCSDSLHDSVDITLSEMLVTRGLITAQQADCLERLSTDLLSSHDGDVEATMSSFLPADDTAWADDSMGDAPTQEVNSGSRFREVGLASLTVTGEAVDRYTMPEDSLDGGVVGQGGMGRVLRVVDHHLGREVAFKELLTLGTVRQQQPAGSDEDGTPLPSVAARFLREARVTAQLEHPSIVPVYELGRRRDGRLYYTMKLVRGRTLAEAMRAAQSVDGRLALLSHYRDLCQAVSYAHSRGVIHRDIKPQNVMIGEFGETVLLDWGLAKVEGREDARGEEMELEIRSLHDLPLGGTIAGAALGTPSYMSPEQAAGQLTLVDKQSDVWSLGAVLYQLLCGRAPFTGRNVAEVLAQAVVGKVPRMADLGKTVPRDLAAICQRAMAKNPSERYASARELAADLEAYLSGRRVEAHAYSSWELLARFAAANKALCGFAALLVTVLVISSLMLFSAYDRAESARLDAVAGRVAALVSEGEAKANLRVALKNEAESLLAERDQLGASLYAAAALATEPISPPLPAASPESPAANVGRDEMERAARLRSIYLRSIEDAQVESSGSLDGHSGFVFSLDFSPSSGYLASGSWDRTVRLWRVDNRSEVVRMERHKGYVYSVRFSLDGRLLASTGGDGEVHLWSVPSGQHVAELTGHDGNVWTGAFSPDGRLLVTGGADGTVRLWDTESHTQTATASGHQGYLFSAAFSPDGSTVVTGGEDATVRLWTVPALDELRTFSGHSGPVRTVSFKRDGTGVISAGWDGMALSWDLDVEAAPAVVGRHDDYIWSAALSDNGRLLATASSDNTVRLWQQPEGELLASLRGRTRHAWSVALAPSSTLMATGGKDNVIRLWRLTQARARLLRPASGRPTAIGVSASGALMAVGLADGGLQVWDPGTGIQISLLPGHDGQVESLSFSPDGTLLASAGRDNRVRLWRGPEFAEIETEASHDGDAYAVAFSPSGSILASGGRDGAVFLRDPRSAAPRTKHPADMERVLDLAWSPDGLLLAVAGTGSSIAIREVADWSLRCSLTGHEDWVSSLEFDHQGMRLASCGKDGTVRLWDTAQCALLTTLSGHADWVNRTVFSTTGNLLLSGGDDAQVRVWDSRRGTLLHLFNTGKGVRDVAFLPGSSDIVFPEENDVRLLSLRPELWDRTPSSLLEEARLRAGETLTGFERQPSN
jgi:eukaryotic-like serine/threonine-protein kinase